MIYFLLLLSLLLGVSTTQCPTYTSPACRFIFWGGNCDFHSCESRDSQSNTSESSQSLYTWRDCISECCASSSILDSNHTLAVLQKVCQAAPDEDDFDKMIIGFCVAVPLSILLIYCAYWRKCSCRSTETVEIPSPSLNEDQAVQQNKRTIKTNSQVDFSSFRSSILIEQRKNESGLTLADRYSREVFPCSICLEDSPNAKTPCGHSFHVYCLAEWLRKQGTCPECRATVAGVEMRCLRCGKGARCAEARTLGEEYLCRWCRILTVGI